MGTGTAGREDDGKSTSEKQLCFFSGFFSTDILTYVPVLTFEYRASGPHTVERVELKH